MVAGLVPRGGHQSRLRRRKVDGGRPSNQPVVSYQAHSPFQVTSCSPGVCPSQWGRMMISLNYSLGIQFSYFHSKPEQYLSGEDVKLILVDKSPCCLCVFRECSITKRCFYFSVLPPSINDIFFSFCKENR